MTECSTEPLWHPPAEAITLVELFRALADPTRLEMLRKLLAADGELTCSDFGCATKQLATHHLRILREAGLTITREQGRHRYVRLRREILDDGFPDLLPLLSRP